MLDHTDAAGLQIDQRLVMHFECAALHGVRKIEFEAATCLRP